MSPGTIHGGPQHRIHVEDGMRPIGTGAWAAAWLGLYAYVEVVAPQGMMVPGTVHVFTE